jgi:hypothetical protein
MSLALDVPEELGEFLHRPGPASLLIRGESGTGKTLLALGLLNLFEGRRVLVTARAPDPELLSEYARRIPADRGEVEIITPTPGRTSADGAGSPAHWSVTARAPVDPEFRPRRSSDALPPSFEAARAAIRSAGATLVVFDGWETLLSEHVGLTGADASDPQSGAELERMIFAAWMASSAHVVVVSSQTERGQLDYLADASCLLSLTEFDDRPLRLLKFLKLRGRAGRSMEYPFTVFGGRFRCFSISPHGYPLESARTDEDPQPLARSLWPGSLEFVERFGRLAPGGLTLIEADSEVPVDVVRLLTIPMMTAALRTDCPVIFAPPPSMTPEEVWRPFADSVLPETFGRRMFALTTTRLKDPNVPWAGAIHPIEGTQPLGFGFVPARDESSLPARRAVDPEEFASQVPGLQGFLAEMRGSRARSLSIGYADGNFAVGKATGFPMNADAYATTLRAYLVGEEAHGVAIGRPREPLFETIRSYADLCLNVRALKGRYILHASRPWSSSFIIALGESSGAAQGPYHLVPLV